jgi:hypothetical protein
MKVRRSPLPRSPSRGIPAARTTDASNAGLASSVPQILRSVGDGGWIELAGTPVVVGRDQGATWCSPTSG